jgi:hypothetical protein
MVQRSTYERYEKIESISSSYSALSKFVERGLCPSIPEGCTRFAGGIACELGDKDLFIFREKRVASTLNPQYRVVRRRLTNLILIKEQRSHEYQTAQQDLTDMSAYIRDYAKT